MSFLSIYNRFFSQKEKFDHEKILCEAYEFQVNEEYDSALELYEKLYCHYKKNKMHFKLAQVINNMIVAKIKKGLDAKKLYKELSGLRFQQFLRSEERFGVDYIYTLLMGVEWFDLPIENTLNKAKKILNNYKNQPFYSKLLEKIEDLEKEAFMVPEYQIRKSA